MKTLLRMPLTIAALFLAGEVAAEPLIATVEVENTSCALCSLIVKWTLRRVDGVHEVTVVERDGVVTATITFDDDRVTPEALVRVTTDIGYPSTVQNVRTLDGEEPADRLKHDRPQSRKLTPGISASAAGAGNARH